VQEKEAWAAAFHGKAGRRVAPTGFFLSLHVWELVVSQALHTVVLGLTTSNS